MKTKTSRRATLRRALLVPALGLLLVGVPALGLDAGRGGVLSTTQVPLVAATTSASATSAPGWQASAEVDANLVGVTWSGDQAAHFVIEAHARGGGWSSAGEVGSLDVGPDATSADATAARLHDESNATEPVWVGDADAIRVRLVSGSVGAVSLAAVRSQDPGVPAGSAAALGLPAMGSQDRYGYAVALLVAGLVIGAVAVGGKPSRSRRVTSIAVALVVVGLAGCLPPPPPPPPPPAPAAPAPSPAPPSGVLPAQPAITMRSAWGADLAWNPDPGCAPGPTIASSLKFAVVHHTVNSNTYGPGDSANMVRAIWAYHVQTLHYCDIAYNFLVDRYGQIFEGRMGGIDKAVVAAHAGGFNTGSVGTALLGTFTSEQPPQAMWDSLVHLLAWKLSVHHVDPSLGFSTTAGSDGRWPAGTTVSFPNAIVGHRDVNQTECPGDAFYPRLAELRGAVQPLIGWPTS